MANVYVGTSKELGSKQMGLLQLCMRHMLTDEWPHVGLLRQGAAACCCGTRHHRPHHVQPGTCHLHAEGDEACPRACMADRCMVVDGCYRHCPCSSSHMTLHAGCTEVCMPHRAMACMTAWWACEAPKAPHGVILMHASHSMQCACTYRPMPYLHLLLQALTQQCRQCMQIDRAVQHLHA